MTVETDTEEEEEEEEPAHTPADSANIRKIEADKARILNIFQTQLKNLANLRIEPKRHKDGFLGIVERKDAASTLELLFRKDIETVLYLEPNLTPMQYASILVHEVWHLMIRDITLGAENMANLATINPLLHSKYNMKEVVPGEAITPEFSEHSYMGNYTDIMEMGLRQFLPGQSEEYYQYTPWASLVGTPEFEALPYEFRESAKNYYRKHGL